MVPTKSTDLGNLKSDIVIIGGGGAGLAAAAAAGELGASVIVLEKKSAVGGNANMAEGFFAAESRVQESNMVDARRDDLFRKAMDYYHWAINPRILRSYINKSGDTVRWLEEKGLEFSVAPTLRNQMPLVWHVLPKRGVAIVKALMKDCEQFGVRVICSTSAEKILTAKDGSVTGVVAKNKDGEFNITTKSVIIATGGFGGNREMLQKYFSYSTQNLQCNGIPHMGDGIRMAWDVGADSEGLGNTIGGGPCLPNMRGWVGSDMCITATSEEPNTIWVNKRGERFVDECITFNPFEAINLLLIQPDQVTYSLFDEKVKKSIEEQGIIRGVGIYFMPPRTKVPDLGKMLEAEVAKGSVKISNSWEEIAKWMGADPAVLKATLDEYNASCDTGYDEIFTKDRRYLQALRTPPYYAVKGYPFFMSTVGGIKINHRMEVVNKQDLPIKGLYAGGVDAGGWVSGTYCGHLAGSGLGFSLNSGRIAAENAVKYVRG